jgi:hypothetical protein
MPTGTTMEQAGAAADLGVDAEVAPAETPGEIPGAAPGKPLSDAARRALLEAQARREAQIETAASKESGGPTGLEPTRFGDWERKGLAIDF